MKVRKLNARFDELVEQHVPDDSELSSRKGIAHNVMIACIHDVSLVSRPSYFRSAGYISSPAHGKEFWTPSAVEI